MLGFQLLAKSGETVCIAGHFSHLELWSAGNKLRA